MTCFYLLKNLLEHFWLGRCSWGGEESIHQLVRRRNWGKLGHESGLIASSKLIEPFSLSKCKFKIKEGWKYIINTRDSYYKKMYTLITCWQILYSEKNLSFLCIHIHYSVERTHKSAIELVKNNLLFFNIFIDTLNNKIQVLINTLIQDKFIANNSRRMIQVAVIHW